MRSRRTSDGVKYAIKWTVAQGMYRSGLLHLWSRLRLRNQAVVLTYHRVLRREDAGATWSHPAIIVSPETFEKHLAVLRRTFRVLSLAEFDAAMGREGGFEAPSCLITFDDGWRDTYTEAWPLLRKSGLPAVVFLPGCYIGSDDTFWQERLGHLLFETWKRAQSDRELSGRARVILGEAGMGDLLDAPPDTAASMVVDRIRVVKTDAAVDTNRLLQRLSELVGGASAVPPLDRFMSWDEVREMAAGRIAFGAHSESHRILTRLPEADVLTEAQGSKDRIGRELRTEVTAFSYPNGDWNPLVSGAVRTTGYRLAFSMDRGAVSTGDNRYSIRRTNIHEDVSASIPMFLARILGLF